MRKIVLLVLACMMAGLAHAADLSYGSKFAQITNDGALKVDGSGVVQPVSGSLTIAASTQPTIVQFYPSSNTVTVGNFPGSQAVTGTFWQSVQPVSGSFYQVTQPVSIASMPSTPVTGTFWQVTQPVSIASMPSTPVTGTFWQATQPVSVSQSTMGVVAVGNFPVTGTFYQSIQPVSGNVSVIQSTVAVVIPSGVPLTVVSTGIPVTGAFFQTTQPITHSGIGQPVTSTYTTVVSTGLPIFNSPGTQITVVSTGIPITGSISNTGFNVNNTPAVSQSGTWTMQVGNTPNTTAILANPAPASLIVSSASAVAVQLSTGPAAVSGQFHYITFIEVTAYSTVARTGGVTPVTCTSSNLPGPLAFTFDTAAAVGSSQSRTYTFPSPVKSTASNTNTLITCPATASIIWRLNLFYYVAP